MSASRQLIIGLPQSGKTTYIAALWHVVQGSEVPTALHLKQLRGDRKHLNTLREKWLKYETAVRTSSGGEASVSMLLADTASGEETEVYLPDLAGESIRSQWTTRKWTVEYEDWVKQASGALIFVHPHNLSEPDRIDTVEKLEAELKDPPSSGEAPAADAGAAALEETTVQWNPETSPTQVQLVDLLQLVIQKRERVEPLRIAVVISAWDLVEKLNKSPDEWLTRRMPLLDQYLSANTETLVARRYGISAQGGRIPEDIPAMKAKPWPSHRVKVRVGADESHDLTAPLKWVMRG